MTATAKGRCVHCECKYPLRKSGVVIDHQLSGNYEYCLGGGRLPLDPARAPTWEARALDADARARNAEATLEATLERIRSLPVRSGGVIRSADLVEALGDDQSGEAT